MVSSHWGKQLVHIGACFIFWSVNLIISILSQLNPYELCLDLAMLPFSPLGWSGSGYSAKCAGLLFLSSCLSSQARIPAFWSSSGLQWLIGCDSGKFTAALLPRTLLWWNKVHDVEFLCLDIYIYSKMGRGHLWAWESLNLHAVSSHSWDIWIVDL